MIVTVPRTIGKGAQEIIAVGLECRFSSWRSSLLYYSIGSERLRGAWARGYIAGSQYEDKYE